MGLDALISLVVDGTDGQIALQFFERLLDFGELNVVFPQLGGVLSAEVGAQQVAAFTAPDLAQFLAISYNFV